VFVLGLHDLSRKWADPRSTILLYTVALPLELRLRCKVVEWGSPVVLIEPTDRIGGLTTGGLGQTDIGNKQAIGGISREFYENIKKYYDDPENWKWEKRSEYIDGGQTRTEEGEATMWTFEPSAALAVYKDMMDKEKIKMVYNERLNRESGVKKVNGKIESITMESGKTYKGKVFSGRYL